MQWKEISIHETTGSENDFHAALLVWLKRPNVCNKIISCSVIEPVQPSKTKEENGKRDTVSFETHQFLLNLPQLNLKCTRCENVCFSYNPSTNFDQTYYVRKLVPRRPDLYQKDYEFVVVTKTYFIFIPQHSSSLSPDVNEDVYMISYGACSHCFKESESCAFLYAYSLLLEHREESTNGTCELSRSNLTIENGKEITDTFRFKHCFTPKHWLCEKLMPTLLKWCNEENENADKAQPSLPPSLSLLDREKYTSLYHHLKMKYGREISEIWPEVTDPQKYVYEDVAIATYLLVLWEQERVDFGIELKQSFIDLGCGNGLLVHILNEEGHTGKGLDIRRRKVWSVYGSNTNLEEAVITPDNLSLIKGYDWLLGNHSDELTPWIPVMAARIGYNTRYWVLPCCFFDFYTKYERTHSNIGQYEEYLNFVTEVGQQCGFQVEVDVMRIPSTKRVCLVGMRKSHVESEHGLVLERIHNFMTERSKTDISQNEHFQARPKQEKVCNCTKIERGIQHEITMTITSSLLMSFHPGAGDSDWNRGGELLLHQAVNLLSDTLRLRLKNECGGLQTLLRNHSQLQTAQQQHDLLTWAVVLACCPTSTIRLCLKSLEVFVIRDGRVRLRDWSSLEDKRKRKKKRNNVSVAAICKKTKQCWFYTNHPNRCPRSPDTCTFLHGDK